MVYQALLSELLLAVDGAYGALLLDASGEVVVEAGLGEDRHRLIGAYQGIALSTARKIVERYAMGGIGHIVCRYTWGGVIVWPLKEGYYLTLSLPPEASIPRILYSSLGTRQRLNDAL